LNGTASRSGVEGRVLFLSQSWILTEDHFGNGNGYGSGNGFLNPS
jgi:hypothetical protein